MKVHLVFPPVWLTEIPYLSIPALRAFIRTIPGVHTRSLDLNIQLWRHLRSDASLERILSWSKERLEHLGFLDTREELDEALRLSNIATYDLKEFITGVRRRKIPVPVLQSCIKMYFQKAVMDQSVESTQRRWQQDRDYHDPYMNSISLSHLASSSARVLESLDMTEEKNPYLRLMPELYREVVGSQLPDLLGISVTAVNQVIPAFALSNWMRSAQPNCRIVWGGQWVTHVLDRPQELSHLLRVVDGMIAGEGEVPLARIIGCELEGSCWESVPNLFYLKEGVVVRPKHHFESPNLSHLPAPDFEGIPLEEFDHPGTLPLQTSRGCSWNRCRFCSYVVLDPVYKRRSPNLVVDDITQLVNDYGIKEIAFTDAIMEPDHFLRIAEEICAREIRIKWRGFGRFDKKFTAQYLRALRNSGCSFIIWGMESGSDKILRLMQKGNTQNIVRQTLRNSAHAGIHNRLCLLYGYPSETEEDRSLTVDFLRRNMEFYHSIAFSPLSVERGTPIADGPEASLVEGLSSAEDIELTCPVLLSEKKLEYLAATEQMFRQVYLQIERRGAWGEISE